MSSIPKLPHKTPFQCLWVGGFQAWHFCLAVWHKVNFYATSKHDKNKQFTYILLLPWANAINYAKNSLQVGPSINQMIFLSFIFMNGCNFSKYFALNSLHCTVYIKIYFKHIFFHSWIFRKMEHSSILHIKFTANIKKSSHKICGPSFLPFLIYTSLTLDISSISGWTFVEHSVTNQSHAFNSSQLTLGSSSFQ